MLHPDGILQNRYQILEVIGRGGMGAVYKALDLRLQATIALKETHFPDNPQLRRAFEREAQLLANLSHPTLPRVSDYFVDGDGQFIVMEYIPGDDLQALLRKRGAPFTLDQILPWGGQLFDALDYLHTRDHPVIHRDIKPSNLKLTARNHIVLLDFGLSKGSTVENTHLTQDTSVFGFTPNYASLEQIQNQGTDPRSDLYSLAATLYTLLTARMPPGALLRADAREHGLPDPLFLGGAFDALGSQIASEVIAKAMSLGREQRYASAALMRAALFEGLGYSVSTPSLPALGEARSQEGTYTPGAGVAAPDEISQLTLPTPGRVGTSGAPPVDAPEGLTVHLTTVRPPADEAGLSPNTVLLRHSEIFRFRNEDIFEDLILHKDYERLWRSLIHAGGGRNLLTGYGPFGGTSLLRCAVAKARAELQRAEPQGGTLLVFYFRILKETKSSFEIEAESFGFGHLRAQKDVGRNTDLSELKARAGRKGVGEPASIMDFSLASPLKGTFFEPSGHTRTAPAARREYDFSEFVADLNAFFKQRKHNSALRQIVLRLIRSENLPSRVVFIIDRVKYLETLESLCKTELFSNERIRAVAVAREEDFNAWSNADRRLRRIEFSKWYVPCLWDIDLDKSLFNNLHRQPKDSREEYRRFLSHLEYRGRGSFGNIISELKRPVNTNFGSRSNYIDLDSLGSRAEVQHNAWVQKVLGLNWDTILGDMFGGPKQEEKTDRACIGVYYLLDWMALKSFFTRAEILEAARASPVVISDNTRINLQTIDNLLDVFTRNNYLSLRGGAYRLIWNKDKQPRCRRVRPRPQRNVVRERRARTALRDTKLTTPPSPRPDDSHAEGTSKPRPAPAQLSIDGDQTAPAGAGSSPNTPHEQTAGGDVWRVVPPPNTPAEPSPLGSTPPWQPGESSILIPSPRNGGKVTKVFVSYSHADKVWLKRLRIHLKPIEREGRIELWDDTKIKTGAKWDREIERAVSDATVAILLISANYIASDFIVNNELPPLLASCEKSGTLILPIILSPCIFEQTSLAQFQTVNTPNSPLSSMKRTQRETVFVQVVRAIEAVSHA